MFKWQTCLREVLVFSETHKLTWLQSCQPWSYLRLVAYSFVGSCEGA